MGHFRVCTDRYKEHLTRIRDSELQSDPKYNFMSRQGGPGSWIYVPYIFSSLPVKKQMLLTLESREIQLCPKHLNKEQTFRRKRVTKGTAAKSKHAARVRDLPSASWRHRGSEPVRLQLMYGNTSAPNVVATGPIEAFSTAQSVYIHSSLIRLYH